MQDTRESDREDIRHYGKDISRLFAPITNVTEAYRMLKATPSLDDPINIYELRLVQHEVDNLLKL